MRVNIIKWQNVIIHCGENNAMIKAFGEFKKKLDLVDWNNPSDASKSFNSTDLINCSEQGSNRLIFNIGGNKYRMICGYHFGTYKVTLFIKFVGTHKEYDKIDVCDINMFALKL